MCPKVTEELTSMPVPSASLSAFVLVLGGFELGDTSVATDMIEVSPSIFDGAVEVDMAGVAAESAAPVADAVLFRGMTVLVRVGVCETRRGGKGGGGSWNRAKQE